MPSAGRYFCSAVGSKPAPKRIVNYKIPELATGGRGGGYKPPPPDISIKLPDLPPEAYQGPSLIEVFSKWWWGSPPEIELKIQKKKDAEFDISQCILVFIHAVASVAKDMQSSAEERAEGSQSEPTGVTLKKSKEGLEKAFKDFANCIKKRGMSNAQALQSICESEAKSLVDSIAKYPLKAKGSITDFKKNVDSAVQHQNEEVQRIRTVQDKLLAELEKEHAELNAEFRKAHGELKKCKDQLISIFNGATKAYMDIVKNTDGLTRVLPSVIKALEKMRDDPSEANLASVSKALGAQVEEVKKSVGKEDKQFKTFLAEITKFEKKWV